jgi:hypothetical protein
MGVHGFAWILVEKGYLPQHRKATDSTSHASCCSTSLWRDPRTLKNEKFAAQIQTIPPHSKVRED